MSKTTTIGVRVDEQLKNNVNEVFQEIGLPLSFGIELFLKQVVEDRKLPFAINEDKESAEESEKRELDFWKSFIVWHFGIWPLFDSTDMESKAREELGYTGESPLAEIQRYLSVKESSTESEDEKKELRRISLLASRLGTQCSDAKELIYWALGMDKAFVPSLSAKYSDVADTWRYQFLKARAKRGSLVRTLNFQGESDCLPQSIDELDDDEIIDFAQDWLMSYPGDDTERELLETIAYSTSDYEVLQRALTAVGMLDDFEEYVETILFERIQETEASQ